MMFWFGIVLLVYGILGAAFKGYVVWNVSREPYGGGGVPTFDFVIFWPIPIALGVSWILETQGILPFYGFGVLLYVWIFMAFRWLHIWFDNLGERERRRLFESDRNRGSNRGQQP